MQRFDFRVSGGHRLMRRIIRKLRRLGLVSDLFFFYPILNKNNFQNIFLVPKFFLIDDQTYISFKVVLFENAVKEKSCRTAKSRY